MSWRIAPLLTSKVMLKKMPGLKRFGEQISTRLLQESLIQNKETKGDLVCTQPREEVWLLKSMHCTIAYKPACVLKQSFQIASAFCNYFLMLSTKPHRGEMDLWLGWQRLLLRQTGCVVGERQLRPQRLQVTGHGRHGRRLRELRRHGRGWLSCGSS